MEVDTKAKPKVKGGPVNRIVYKAESVHIRVSCRVFLPQMISEPVDRRWLPAVFVEVGVQSKGASWSDHRTKRRSCSADPNAFEPNAITCLSVPDTNSCRTFVGASEAPD